MGVRELPAESAHREKNRTKPWSYLMLEDGGGPYREGRGHGEASGPSKKPIVSSRGRSEGSGKIAPAEAPCRPSSGPCGDKSQKKKAKSRRDHPRSSSLIQFLKKKGGCQNEETKGNGGGPPLGNKGGGGGRRGGALTTPKRPPKIAPIKI